MRYQIVVFGVKDTSETIIEYIHETLAPVDLVVTVSDAVKGRNEIAGVKGLDVLTSRLQIPLFEADSYKLDDEKSQTFFKENEFDLGIVMGWQRLIPKSVLDAFAKGIFGFHGNAGYLPFGRGRSPLNWSILLGDTRFNLNLFRYDEKADSPNVFATEMFSINAHDDIRTAQYKNLICSKTLIAKLIAQYKAGGDIPIRTASKDFDTWYEKRTAADGKIDWHGRTRGIYNLIRAVAPPFPGAFCYVADNANDGSVTATAERQDADDAAKKVKILRAHPFDEMIDFSAYAPGEIVDVFDGKPIVRVVDGSLLIDEYESATVLQKGMLLY